MGRIADTPVPLPSAAMKRVLSLAARVAPTDATVLITGESGVGKEYVARHVHERSRRRHAPFVPVNCGEFAETLLETELFGHRRGAFTGAVEDRPGVFESANRGTLFLDEIGDVSPALQVRLLRVLQAREVRRVGEVRARPIDVRLIAATHRDLAAEVASGRFREDLYYRLRVVDVHVLPLRDRPADVAVLMEQLLPRIAARMERPIRGYTDAARRVLTTYAWPGNVRELAHALERACAVSEGPLVDVGDLPDAVQRNAIFGPARAPRPLREVEREYVRLVVQRHGGNRRRAAEELQISLATLKRKLIDSTADTRSTNE
jgi:two-component system, NtrC family, response regulator HydG